MDELRFRGGDLTFAWRRLWLPAGLIGVQTVIATMRNGAEGLGWTAAALAVVIPASVLLLKRCWTEAGEDGIRIYRGLGRVHGYPWGEVRWIAVRHQSGGGGGMTSVRITLVDGRRRTLPGLQESTLYPRPGFDADLARLRASWERHVDPSFRLGPPPREPLRRRLRGVLPGVALLVCALVMLPFGVVRLLHGLDDAHRYDAAPRCTVARPADAAGRCLAVEVRVVRAIDPAADGSATTAVTVGRDWDGAGEVLRLGELPEGLRGLHTGDEVRVTTALDGSTVTELASGATSVPTVDSPHRAVAQDEAGLVFAAAGTALFGLWCVAVRRAPRGRYPWWAPLGAVSLLPVAVIGTRADTAALPLEPWSYWPAVVTLLLGLAVGHAVVLRGRAARRRRAVPVAAPEPGRAGAVR
ncbi:hypothetical protein ACFYUY_09065 [Kitasatospora sp. NPDC004745]|uniref:hypothetical protein n=1 Tax=Kitasatospora sp. NPDC004745 TaxID=3364019 RepID=UPI00367F00DD